ncbi:hypothetical protein Fot_37443 [Forsythia ovata]|uniref:Uncharacterized protein n=1 Tax=Forsythia ovata TaxID=205694 RepID=A0ABD1RZ03_9LAMI
MAITCHYVFKMSFQLLVREDSEVGLLEANYNWDLLAVYDFIYNSNWDEPNFFVGESSLSFNTEEVEFLENNGNNMPLLVQNDYPTTCTRENDSKFGSWKYLHYARIGIWP